MVSSSLTPRTSAYQAPLSMGFPRQEYWSGLPFPSLGIFLTQGLSLGLLHCRQILYCLSHQGSPTATPCAETQGCCLFWERTDGVGVETIWRAPEEIIGEKKRADIFREAAWADGGS